MKKILFLICLILQLLSLEASVKQKYCKYYLSVCAIFRNEAPYLKEWIEFHRLMGVEHFYLFNNSSTDNYLEVLAPYIKNHIVELKDWPSTPETYVPAQKDAYNYCIKKCVGKTFWLAPIDIDEFIVPVHHSNLVSFLSKYDKEKYLGAIRINWQLYGTSHKWSVPKGKLLVETLTMKAPWDYETKDRPNNTVIKSIIKPHSIKLYRIHEGDFRDKYYAIPKSNQRFQQKVKIDQIRINHYWTRTEDFFHSVKIGRRMSIRDDSYLNVMMKKFHDLNAVEDRIMDRFIPALKKRMKMPIKKTLTHRVKL